MQNSRVSAIAGVEVYGDAIVISLVSVKRNILSVRALQNTFTSNSTSLTEAGSKFCTAGSGTSKKL